MREDALLDFDLITSIKTVQELNDLSLEIDTLEEALFKSEKMPLDKALSLISISMAKKITEIFSKNNLDMNNKSSTFFSSDNTSDRNVFEKVLDKEFASGFLKSLKDKLAKFKIIKLILAFDPSLKTIESIHGFVKEAIGIGYVLDIEVSEKIMGGAIIMFNGKYNDYSLRKTLEETLKNKKEEITKMIND